MSTTPQSVLYSPAFAQRIAAIQKTGTKNLVVIPLLLGLAIMLIPFVFSAPVAFFTKESLTAPVTIASTIGMWCTVIFSVWIIGKVCKFPAAAQGLPFDKAAKEWPVGLVLGCVALALVTAVIAGFGAATVSQAVPMAGAGALALGAFYFMAQGMWEEVVYRGFMQPHFAKKWNNAVAIVVTAVLFAVMHGANPGLGFMPLLNLVLYGFVFGVLYWRTGSLWITGAAHTAWNFAQGYIVGAPVSGNRPPASILSTIPVDGHELVSGGNFGLEGSIITTILGVVVIAGLIFSQRKATAAATV